MSKNNFEERAWLIFQDAWCCWMCGMNTADCLHHIVGRGNGNSKVERSILNAAPLCNQKCHLAHHSLLRTNSFTAKLLKQTYKYLENYGYVLNKIDLEFIEKYKRFYK